MAYCATCDGEFFTDKEIFVIGGGFAAAEESVFLTKFAKHVTIFIRKDDFSCAASVADKAKNHKKITVVPNTVVEEVSGKNGLNYIRYKNTKTGEVSEYHAENGDFFGVFVFAGYTPDTELVKDIIEQFNLFKGIQKDELDKQLMNLREEKKNLYIQFKCEAITRKQYEEGRAMCDSRMLEIENRLKEVDESVSTTKEMEKNLFIELFKKYKKCGCGCNLARMM